MKKKMRELTQYEEDRLLYADLLDRAWLSRPKYMGEDKKQVEADEKAYQADLKRDAKRTHAARAREHAALAPVLVFCTACGKAHTGTRREMAKFRKCCTTPVGDHKFCRGCAKVVTRAEYMAMPGGNPKGWGTFAKCDACGAQHR